MYPSSSEFLYLVPEKSTEVEFKHNGLICSMEDISRQHNTQAISQRLVITLLRFIVKGTVGGAEIYKNR